MPSDLEKFSAGYKGKKKSPSPAAPTLASQHEHEGRTPQPGVPAGPRDTEYESASGYEYSPEAYAETGLTPPGSSHAAAEDAARKEQNEARRQERAEARQARLVDRFVTKAYKAPKQPRAKSGPLEPGGIFAKSSKATAKAKSNVSDLRTKLLSHPEVEKANAEGKVVGPKGLGKLVQGAKPLGPPAPKTAKPKSNPLALKGPLSHPKPVGPGFENELAKEHPALTRVKEIEAKKQSESGLDFGDIASAAKDTYSTLQHQQGPNPVGAAVEDYAGKWVDAAKKRVGGEISGSSFLHPLPTGEELELLADAATAADGGPALIRGGAKAAEVGADILGKLTTKEGAKELGVAAAEKGGKLYEGAKAAGKGALHIPGYTYEAGRGALSAAKEGVPKALRATPDALKSSPEYLGKGAKAIPGVSGRAAVGAGKFAGRSGGGALHNFATLSALGGVQKTTGADIPGLEPLKRAGALAEGTEHALAHNLTGTLATTGRTLPALFTAPASIAQAGGESVLQQSPKPLENTISAIAGGTFDMGKELLSGDPETVQSSIEHKVGVTPFFELPSALKKLHDSNVYEAPRGAVRRRVEGHRDAKRTKAVEAETGARFHRRKAPKQPVPVSSRPGEHYIIPGWGKRIEANKAKRAVALDTTRASARAAMEGDLVGKEVVKGFQSRVGGASRLARKLDAEYEAAAWPFAKYGIPHSERGKELVEALAGYFPDAKTPVPGSLTDRMAVNAASENPGIFTDRKHAAGTEKIREVQRELARLRGRNDVAAHRVQNDFTNYLSGKTGLAPVLKDYERVSERANQFTNPADAAAALRSRANELNSKASGGDTAGSVVTDSGLKAKAIDATSPGDLVTQWKKLGENDWVWVYHGTTAETASKFEREGVSPGEAPHASVRDRKNKAPSKGTYITLSRGMAEKYARESDGQVVALRVRKRDVSELPKERGLPGGRTTALVKWDQAILHSDVKPENVAVLNGDGSLSSAVNGSAAKREADTLRGEAAKAEEDAQLIEKGGVVSREGAWAHYEALNRDYDRLRKDAKAKLAESKTEPKEVASIRRKLTSEKLKAKELRGRLQQLEKQQGARERGAGTYKTGDRKGKRKEVAPLASMQRARTDLLDAEANARGLQAELNAKAQAHTSSRRAEADDLAAQARAVAIQKKGLYSELKGYTRPSASRDASALPVSSRKMKEEFRREQNARAKELGLVEPVYVADTKPVLPGNPAVAVERPIPTGAQHFKEGSLARSGEADARFERVLHNSAIAPRTRMAINELIHNTVNERKLPVKVRGQYKHVLTQAEEEWAKRHGTWPANAVALDSGLVKQGIVGAHSIDGETVGHLLSVAERGGADSPAALGALAEKYPDIKDELTAAADTKGRKVIAVEGAAIQELKDQFAPTKHPTARAVANLPTRIILNDPAWVFAQFLATGTPILASLGPDALIHAPRAVKAMVDIQKKPISDQARIAAMVGTSAGVFGTPKGAFAAAHDPFSDVRAIRHSKIGRRLWELANGETMGKWDRWNSAKMREYTAAVKASKGFRNWFGGFKQLNKDMEIVGRRTKGMKPAERLDYISRHPDLARSVQKDLNRMAGNWNSFTALERKIAPFTIFYPWIRYSIDWAFHVFPLNHPVAATALSLLAQRNSNELQELAAVKAHELGLKGITAETPLSNAFGYANPVWRNANDEPVENPKGTRFAPLGVFGELVTTGDPLKVLSAANPYIATGISLATKKNLYTGQDQEGSFLENLAEDTASLFPAARGAEAAIGFRGFTKHRPQSATSKAYELLAGGKRQKTERSLLNPYLPRGADRGALENDLNVIEERIGKTGGAVQDAHAGNLYQSSAKNKREIKKLERENKQAYREKEILLKAIDPSGKLSRQSRGEFEHFYESLPSPFESSEDSGKIFGGSSTGKSEPIFGGKESGEPTSIFGPKDEEKKPEYRPPNEDIKVPDIGGVVGKVLGPLAEAVGGSPAQAATRKGQTGPTQFAHWRIPGQAADAGASKPQSKVEATTQDLLSNPNKRVTHFGHLRVLGKVPVKSLVQAAKNGTLKEDAHGRLTTPATRQARARYLKAKKVFDEKSVPSIEGFEHQDQKEFAEWFSHYSKLPPKLAGEWVKQEGGGYSNGGEAGKQNWLGVGYPAHPTSFSESAYFNGTPKAAAKASAEWLEGKIGGEYDYHAADSIIGISKLAKSGASEDEIRSYIEGPSAWGTGEINTAGTISVASEGNGAPASVRKRLKSATAQLRKAGIDPSEIEADNPRNGEQVTVPYKAFGKHVRRDLRAVVKSKGYSDDSSTSPITIQGAHGGTLIREVQGSSGVASVIDKNKEPEIAARLLLLSAKTGQPVYVLSGARTPEQSSAVGGSPDDPHAHAEAMDIGVGAPTLDSALKIPESVYESVGLHRPYLESMGSAEGNHVELLNGGTPPTGNYEAGAPAVGGAVPAASGGGAPAVANEPIFGGGSSAPGKGANGKTKTGNRPAEREASKGQKLHTVEQLYAGLIPGVGGSGSTIPGFSAGSPIQRIDLAAIGASIAKERERLKAGVGS